MDKDYKFIILLKVYSLLLLIISVLGYYYLHSYLYQQQQLLLDIQYDIVGLTANCAKSCHLTGPYEWLFHVLTLEQ